MRGTYQRNGMFFRGWLRWWSEWFGVLDVSLVCMAFFWELMVRV